MDKQTAINKAGGISALARILGVSRQAVFRWKTKIPDLRLYQLKERRPEWFKKKR